MEDCVQYSVRSLRISVLPFGLVNAPAVFQALINDVLRDMLNIFVFVYLDDILIFSPSLQVHIQHVRRVLQRLLENRLFVKAEKCTFHARSVTFWVPLFRQRALVWTHIRFRRSPIGQFLTLGLRSSVSLVCNFLSPFYTQL